MALEGLPVEPGCLCRADMLLPCSVNSNASHIMLYGDCLRNCRFG